MDLSGKLQPFHKSSTTTENVQEIEERKNLLSQFRKWKERRRKPFHIVVTEKGRREMARKEMEKANQRTN